MNTFWSDFKRFASFIVVLAFAIGFGIGTGLAHLGVMVGMIFGGAVGFAVGRARRRRSDASLLGMEEWALFKRTMGGRS